MSQLKMVWFIALKDLKLFVRDRLALFFFVLFPFMFVVLFNFLLSGTGSEDSRLVFRLVTRESGGISHQIIAALETKDESALGPGEPVFVWEKDYQELRQKVEDREIGGFLAFPEDFSEGVLMGFGARIEVHVNPQAIDERAALHGLASSIASRLGAQQVVSRAAVGLLVEQGIVTGTMPDIARAVMQPFSDQTGPAEESLIEFVSEKVGEVEAGHPSNYVVPGYLVMFVFFAAALSSEAMVRERQNHTLERLLASSVRRPAIVGGIFTGTALKGLVQIVIFWTVGVLAFNVDLGIAPAAVIILSVLMSIMASAFGVMLATLAKTERSAGSIGVLASLIMAPLGGCWWPLFITPQWMQFVAKITPHGWATTGFNKLMVFGGDFGSAVPEMIALAVFAVVFGLIGIWRFRTSAG